MTFYGIKQKTFGLLLVLNATDSTNAMAQLICPNPQVTRIENVKRVFMRSAHTFDFLVESKPNEFETHASSVSYFGSTTRARVAIFTDVADSEPMFAIRKYCPLQGVQRSDQQWVGLEIHVRKISQIEMPGAS